jgi:hypothetical protein
VLIGSFELKSHEGKKIGEIQEIDTLEIENWDWKRKS